jgi:hypothetical protein
LDWSKTMLKSYCNLQKINLNVRYEPGANMMRMCTWWQKRHAKKTKLLHIITCLKSKFILNILLLFTLSLMWAITNANKYFLSRKFSNYKDIWVWKVFKMRPLLYLFIDLSTI